ncbi:MAG: hypothetical protein H0X24_04550 [Ktedonobacterales bacterium]|nr:hypothetical protein [Ktedonobacterales bacterium]
MADQLRVLVVPHTHWDREWYLTFQQFRVRLVRMVDRLLATLDSDLNFTHFLLDGQMIVLEDYLEVQSGAAAALQAYGRAGRIQVGPWYTQPDEFLVSGEALVRNLLIGRRMAAAYGGAMAMGYVPDTFGHIAQLPQILRGFGIETAAFWRGVGREVTQSEFWWAAPDGSRVEVLFLAGEMGYSNARELPLDPAELAKRVAYIAETLLPHATAPAILLMNGSDHLEAQTGLPAALAATLPLLAEQGWQLTLGTLPEYAALTRAASDTWLTYTGEWRSPERAHLLPGVLSTRMWIKQRNAANEALLTQWADPLAAWAKRLGGEDQSALLDVAWRHLLRNQPHDSICGCSIDQVHREMVPRYDQSEQIAEEVIRQSSEVVARHVATQALMAPGDGVALAGAVPVVVMNPTGAVRAAVAEAQVQIAAPPDALVVRDDAGVAVPHVAVRQGGRELFRQSVPSEHVESLLLLVAQGRVLGYRVLGMICDAPDADGTMVVHVEVSEHGEPDLAFTDAAMDQLRAEAARPDVHALDIIITESSWTRLRFAAHDLPAFGGRAYLVCARQLEDVPPPTDLGASATTIENRWLHVAVDPATGTLTITDKTTGMVYPDLHRFEDGGDVGDLYNYAAPQQDRIIRVALAPPTLEITEDSPVRVALRITQQFAVPLACTADRQGRSAETAPCTIISEVGLTVEARRVEVQTTIHNLAEDHRLRVHFPAPFAAEYADAEGAFMVNRRPTRPPVGGADWAEQPVPTLPQGRFVDVTATDATRGLAILNRGLPEYEIMTNADGTATVALTLLRCVGWLSRDDFVGRRGHAGPGLATPEAQMLGTWHFAYALVPHVGTWLDNDALVPHEAEAFTAGVRAWPTVLHAGELPTTWQMVRLGPPALRLSSIKLAEDGTGVIVRWHNPTDAEVIAELATGIPFGDAVRVSLSEDMIAPVAGQADAPGQQWRVPTPGGGIVTLRLSWPNG